jgi:hypothetical protein
MVVLVAQFGSTESIASGAVAVDAEKPDNADRWRLQFGILSTFGLECGRHSMKATLPRYTRRRLLSATKQVLRVLKDSVYGMTPREKLQYQLWQEIFFLKQATAQDCPDNPVLSGFKVYSQVDEDGII